MSLLVVGLSHRTAPIEVLERAALDATGARELAASVCASGAAGEAVVLATCNRLELYADVAAFHPGLCDLSAAIAERTGLPLPQLTDSLRFHHGEQAVAHLFLVAAGLDSMAVGESQVLGQVRAALRRGQEDATAGRLLDGLLQRALRVGKRAHTDTGLDRVGHSLVEAALEGSGEVVGPLEGVRALVVGAGSMSALAATTLRRRGVAEVVVANRTPARAERLAEAVGGRWLALDDAPALRAALAAADVVVSCTGAVGHVLDADLVAAARAERRDPGAGSGEGSRGGSGAAPQLLVDLALPRDVAPGVGDLDGVHVVGLAELGERLARPTGVDGRSVASDVGAARAIVAEEVAAYLAEQRAAVVGPTVAALRSAAAEVVEAELARLRARLPGADERTSAEVERTVHRVVEKLLHTPTVRVKALAAGSEDGGAWAAALRALFALDGAEGTPVGPATAPGAVMTAGTVAEALAAVPTSSGAVLPGAPVAGALTAAPRAREGAS